MVVGSGGFKGFPYCEIRRKKVFPPGVGIASWHVAPVVCFYLRMES